MICGNCGASLNCSCQFAAGKDGKSCCTACVHLYNASFSDTGGVPLARVEGSGLTKLLPTSVINAVNESLKIFQPARKTINTPVITSVKFMNFNK